MTNFDPIWLPGGLESRAEMEPVRCAGRRNGGKVNALGAFLASADKALVCTHATFRFAVETFAVEAFDDRLIAVDEFHHVSANPDNKLGSRHAQFIAHAHLRHLIPALILGPNELSRTTQGRAPRACALYPAGWRGQREAKSVRRRGRGCPRKNSRAYLPSFFTGRD